MSNQSDRARRRAAQLRNRRIILVVVILILLSAAVYLAISNLSPGAYLPLTLPFA